MFISRSRKYQRRYQRVNILFWISFETNFLHNQDEIKKSFFFEFFNLEDESDGGVNVPFNLRKLCVEYFDIVKHSHISALSSVYEN